MQSKHVSLKQYPEAMKPRERLAELGAEALTPVELIAILLGTGTADKTALDLAQDLLMALPEGDLAQLGQQNFRQLCQFSGLGPAKSTRILAALELGRRVNQAEVPLRADLSSPNQVYRLLSPQFAHQKQEHFIVVFVDTKNRYLGQKVVTKGILNSTLVHPREIFQQALAYGAYAFIAAHNHPSGDPKPSTDDLETTRQLVRCGKLMQIELLDHLILGRECFLSLREQEAWLWNHEFLG